MQVGFCLLENGAIRKKNIYHQNFMNIASTTIEVLVWWLWGFGLAFGYKEDINNGFAGNNPAMYATSSFHTEKTNLYPVWIFQFAFCGTATTIISGGICERTTLWAFFFVAVFNTGFVYPIVAYWTWGGGWLMERGY
jgi:Amt family ammonium transporter